MKRIAAVLLAASLSLLLLGCAPRGSRTPAATEAPTQGLVIFTEEETTVPPTETQTAAESLTETETETETGTEAETESITETETETVTELPEDEPLPASVEKDGSYSSPEDVAEYIHTFGTLPANFLTKKQAQKLGWDSSAGNLWDVAPGMSIGGDRFGNREGLLPDGDYHECDVNYDGGYRGAERLIYGADGSIYYTGDHYKSFTQLY